MSRVITAIEKAHIGHLGSIEAIADEKARILRGLEPGGVAVLPADSPLLARLRAAAGGAHDRDVRRRSLGAMFGWLTCAADADGSDVSVADRRRSRCASG